MPLTGGILVAGEYRPLVTHTGSDGELGAHSPTLGLDFRWETGNDRLQVLDPRDNRLFRTYLELTESDEALRDLEAENHALREQLRRLDQDQ